MDNPTPHTLPKDERLHSRKALEQLFSGEHQSLSAYPIRVVYTTTPDSGVRILVSVSKRYFKRAVKRNRIKRQLREAYRLNKEMLTPAQGGLDIAFLWTCNELLPTEKIFTKMQNLLNRINESITTPATDL